MNARRLFHTTIMAALVFSAGCATDITRSPTMPPAAMRADFVTQDQARHLAFTFRKRAAETSELARRIELEASVFGHEGGANHEESIRRSVKELLAAAEEADELARAYGRQVPHGQVQ